MKGKMCLFDKAVIQITSAAALLAIKKAYEDNKSSSLAALTANNHKNIHVSNETAEGGNNQSSLQMFRR